MNLVEIESPYAGDIETHIVYARRCMADSLKRGEAPLASHLLYTQPGILDDSVPDERKLGMKAGKEWSRMANLTAVYTDYGLSKGMERGITDAAERGRRIEFRSIGKNP